MGPDKFNGVLMSLILIIGTFLVFNDDYVFGNESYVVGEWDFNENQGEIAYDKSNYGNTGLVNGPTWSEGISGHCLRFDGTDDFVEIFDSSVLDIISSISIEAWIYVLNTTSDHQVIAAKWYSDNPLQNFNSYVLELRPDGRTLQMPIGGGISSGGYSQAYSSVPLNYNVWNYVVGTYDGSSVKLYLNGELTGTFITSGSIPATDSPLFIGSHNSISDRNAFNGFIDEVRICDRALTIDEIRNRYDSIHFSSIFNDRTRTSGTTGDPFLFQVDVYDGNGVLDVQVEYWFSDGEHSKRQMEGTGPYTCQITIPSGSIDTLHYIFHCVDSIGNLTLTSKSDVTIEDNDGPTFGTDSTPRLGTMGDDFTFSIQITDNIGISSVFVEYWYGTGTSSNVSINGSGQYSCRIWLPSNSNLPLHYLFHCVDVSENWMSTIQKDVTIVDYDGPTFGIDSTPTSGTSGNFFVFGIFVSDNIVISKVYVEYWFGSGTHTNVSMSGSVTFTYQMKIPPSTTSSLHYLFHAVDTSGNWAKTIVKDVTITDGGNIAFEAYSTPVSATTGDTFIFKVSVDTTVSVAAVHVEYWFGDTSRINESMELSGIEYTYSIIIPTDSLLSLHYRFHARKSSGYWFSGVERTIAVIDNDRPVFTDESSPTNARKGEMFRFSIGVEDNIGVRKVVLDYWYDDEEPGYVDITMNRSFEIEIRQDDVQSLHYRFKAEDDSGNVAVTSNRTVQIMGGEIRIDHDGTNWTRGLPILLIIIGFSSLMLILGIILIFRKKKRKEDEDENGVADKTDIIRPVKGSMDHHGEVPIKSPGRGSSITFPGSSMRAGQLTGQGSGGRSRVSLIEDGRKKPLILREGIKTEVCNICLGAIKPGSPIQSCPRCGKSYHRPCVMRLKECPICKERIQ